MSFDQLGLCKNIVDAVNAQNYTIPTPIQEKAIPLVLQGKDLLAGAQTGTGKTAAFTLPMLQKLSKTISKKTRRKVRGLVLTPTRELAAQVGQSIRAYGKNLPLRSTVIYGGVNIKSQMRALALGQDLLVATPGRLLDHLQRGTVDLSHIEILVLDEADRMLDMGFIHDIKKILAQLPSKRQNLLFSATFSGGIKKLANHLLNRPVLLEVAAHNTAADRVSQRIVPVDKDRKRELLSHMIRNENWQQVLVFTRTKWGADKLSRQLEREGISSVAIHGNKSQNARTSALADFKVGRKRVLVATDIAARGLDIDQLPYVVNFELPNVPEDYVHRIGRTGRAGCEGQAVSLVCSSEHKLLCDIERMLKTSIPKEMHQDFKPGSIAQPRLKGALNKAKNGRKKKTVTTNSKRTSFIEKRRNWRNQNEPKQKEGCSWSVI